jgi:hypothetical protein
VVALTQDASLRPDIAELNLLEARGLPGAEALDIASCLRTLDAWAARVEAGTQRLLRNFLLHPAEFSYSLARFQAEALVTVLQRDLGVRYAYELIELPDHEFFRHSEHLFIHGILQGKGGTCSSLPPLYVAVGRRLGYPLWLVSTYRHAFARWDDPSSGERFNIECTSQGFVSHPDEYYLRWPRELSPADAKHYAVLRPLPPAAERACFLCSRAACLRENNRLAGAAKAHAQAANLDPDCECYLKELGWALQEWDGAQRRCLVPGFPPMRVYQPSRQFPNIPQRAENEFSRLWARELVLHHPEAERRWWGPLRSQPGIKPPLQPAFVAIRLPQSLGDHTEIVFHEHLPGDFDRSRALPS